MSDQATQPAAPAAPAATPVAAAVAANAPLTQAQGMEKYRAARGAERAQAANPISDAARTLGQRAREARQERQAQAPADTQQAPIEGQEQHVEDDPAATAGETRDDIDTANGGQPTDTDTGANEGELAEGQTIDLGDGVTVTVDEVRDGFMMKADHTRKTQVLAEERNHFQADRTQRVELFDKMLGAAKQMLPQFKDVVSLMDELGEGPGMREFARQQSIIQHIQTLEQTRQQEQAHHNKQARDAAVKGLSEKHGDKAAARYDAAVDIAHQTLGMPKDYLSTMMAHPEIVELVHDAVEMRKLRASKGAVQRTVADKPRVVKPGARVSTQAAGQRQIQNDHARLKSSGSVADAVALLRSLRGGKGRAG